MTKTMEATDLAATLTAAQEEEQRAAAAEHAAAEARQRAETARIEAERRQRQAQEAWAERTLAEQPERRATALQAVTAATTAFEASPEHPETILPRWLDLARARAVLFTVEVERQTAARVLGHAERPAKLPPSNVVDDLSTLLNRWSQDLLTQSEEGVRESLARATTGKASQS